MTHEERMALVLDKLVIRHGNHEAPKSLKDLTKIEACGMEAAYLLWALREGKSTREIIAGWTDHLPCASSTLTSMVIRMNDRISDDERRSRIMRQIIPLVLDTNGSPELERRRAWGAADWSFRVATPRLLRLTPTLGEWAAKLEAMAPIADEASLGTASSTLYDMRQAAWTYRGGVWKKLPPVAEEAAVAVAAVAAAAVAEVAAVAAAEEAAEAAAEAAAAAVAEAAAAVAAAVAAVAAVAAEAEAAEAAAEAAAAAEAPSVWARMVMAAEKALASGGDYWSARVAARHAAGMDIDKVVRPQFVALRDEMDAGFVDLVRRLAEMSPGWTCWACEGRGWCKGSVRGQPERSD